MFRTTYRNTQQKSAHDSTAGEITLVSMVYITNLLEVLAHYLDVFQKAREVHWHDGIIPGDQIWVELGGDHSGGTFNFVLQIVNIVHPNSIYNTIPLQQMKRSRE